MSDGVNAWFHAESETWEIGNFRIESQVANPVLELAEGAMLDCVVFQRPSSLRQRTATEAVRVAKGVAIEGEADITIEAAQGVGVMDRGECYPNASW